MAVKNMQKEDYLQEALRKLLTLELMYEKNEERDRLMNEIREEALKKWHGEE